MDLNVIKVADRVILRLFNHRQFTSGEINYLIKELCNPAEAAFPCMLTTNQNICLISDKNTENCLNISNDTLSKVSCLLEKADNLLKLEESWHLKEENLLGDLRRKNEQVKRDISKDIKHRLECLNESLLNEELELERSYLAFEKRLVQQS